MSLCAKAGLGVSVVDIEAKYRAEALSMGGSLYFEYLGSLRAALWLQGGDECGSSILST